MQVRLNPNEIAEEFELRQGEITETQMLRWLNDPCTELLMLKLEYLFSDLYQYSKELEGDKIQRNLGKVFLLDELVDEINSWRDNYIEEEEEDPYET